MKARTALWLVAGACSVASIACSTNAPSLALAGTSSSLAARSAERERSHAHDPRTRSPIQHVLVLIGENRTFDHLFATYVPRHGQHVDNLLSKGIVQGDGTPGPRYARSAQATAVDAAPSGWEMSPGSKAPYTTLPPPHVPGYDATAPFATVADAKANENGLADDYYVYLTTGGTGSLTPGQPDTRITNVNALGGGVFKLTGPTMSDDDYAGSPVHRFYQMWQQLDCSAAQASWRDPSGCRGDLFAWVEQTIAAGSNGKPRPAGYAGEGSTALEFYDMRAVTSGTPSSSPTSSRSATTTTRPSRAAPAPITSR